MTGDVTRKYEWPYLLVQPFVAAPRMVVSEVKAIPGVRLPLATDAVIRGLEQGYQ